MSALDVLLDPILHLTVADLYDADDLTVLLSDLGYTLHATLPSVSKSRFTDYILSTPDGTWWAVHMEAVTDDSVWWNEKPYRLLILHNALTEPVTGPATCLADLITNLVTITPPYDHEGDWWTTGNLLLAALDLVPAADRPAQEMLVALGGPRTLLRDLETFRHWRTNVTDPHWRDGARQALAAAAHRLWPTLIPEHDWCPDDDDTELLVGHPRNDWDTAAEKVHLRSVRFLDSNLMDGLARRWAALENRQPDEFTVDTLAAWTREGTTLSRSPSIA